MWVKSSSLERRYMNDLIYTVDETKTIAVGSARRVSVHVGKDIKFRGTP